MYKSATILDDLMRLIFEMLLDGNASPIKPSKGPAREEIGVLLELKNPRARLSRTETKGKAFSCLGELLWYLAGTDDLEFISYYIPAYKQFSDDNHTLYGAYGPRLFKMRGEIDQVSNVIDLLRRKRDSRQAVIQLFDSADIVEDHKDIPCTCTLQFMLRSNRLHMFTTMRSNDAYLGLPHDFFAFTMLQEIVARALGADLGTYKHAVGSLHLYDKDRESAQKYLDEKFQSTVPMPDMPKEDPRSNINRLLEVEADIRKGRAVDKLGLPDYWSDLARLLQIFAQAKDGSIEGIERIRGQMHSDMYNAYIDHRKATIRAQKKTSSKDD